MKRITISVEDKVHSEIKSKISGKGKTITEYVLDIILKSLKIKKEK